jgi:hypothetical protein
MPPRPLLPEDDLYARLEVPVDASFEAIEIAWRALLRRHHPDVAGDDGLASAKAINVAHDWLSSPELRDRYDEARHVRTVVGPPPGKWRPGRGGEEAGARPAASQPRPSVRRRHPDDPRAALARFLDRVARLSADDLDRLDCAEPAPIAFVASIRRFLTPDQLGAVAAAESAVEARLPPTSWRRPAVRDSVLGCAHELVLGEFLDEHLDEPFRGRVRERLTRGWDAAVGKPRYGPNGADVEALIRRVEALSPAELRELAATGTLERLGHEPWPADTTPEEDEVLRVSSVLAGRDVSTVIGDGTIDRAAAVRARRAAARVAHLLVLRHAFPVPEWLRLVEPWRPLLIPHRRTRPATVHQRS